MSLELMFKREIKRKSQPNEYEPAFVEPVCDSELNFEVCQFKNSIPFELIFFFFVLE